jgi:hypothetical protein
MANVLINVPQKEINGLTGGILPNISILRKIAKEATILPDDVTVVSFTPFEIKMLHMALHHQWVNMTDDNGQAVNCRQESADCIHSLLKKFEGLKAETEKEG